MHVLSVSENTSEENDLVEELCDPSLEHKDDVGVLFDSTNKIKNQTINMLIAIPIN